MPKEHLIMDMPEEHLIPLEVTTEDGATIMRVGWIASGPTVEVRRSIVQKNVGAPALLVDGVDVLRTLRWQSAVMLVSGVVNLLLIYTVLIRRW